MLKDRRFAGVLVLALAVRMIGINWGLPYSYHQDEAIIVNHAMAVGAEGWNTHTYMPPQFASYFVFVFYGLYFLVGKLLGLFNSAEVFGLSFIKDPSVFYLIARLSLGVLFGVLSVYFLAMLARKFFSNQIAFWSALCLSLNFLHVQHSHYAYMDISLSFAIILLYYTLFQNLESPSVKNSISCGLAFGWSVSVKYTAAYYFPIILLTFFLAKNPTRPVLSTLKNLCLVAISSVLIYAAVSPYSFFDWPNFISQVGGQTAARGYSGHLHHLFYSLQLPTNPLFFTFAALGAISFWHHDRKKSLVIFLSIALYYCVNIYFTQFFARYMMPLVPAICLLSGIGVSAFMNSKASAGLKKIVVVLFLIEMAVPTLVSDYFFLTKDTRTACTRWFHENVAPDSVVVVDNRFFGPRLTQTAEQVRDKFSLADPIRSKRLVLELKALSEKKVYNTYVLSEFKSGSGSFLFLKPQVKPDFASLKAIDAQYLVLNYSEVDLKFHALKQGLGKNLKLVASFSPFRDPTKRYVEDNYGLTAAPHLLTDYLSRKSLGPYLEIYKVKTS